MMQPNLLQVRTLKISSLFSLYSFALQITNPGLAYIILGGFAVAVGTLIIYDIRFRQHFAY